MNVINDSQKLRGKSIQSKLLYKIPWFLNQIVWVWLTSLYSEVCRSYSRRGQSFSSIVKQLKMDDTLILHPNSAAWPTSVQWIFYVNSYKAVLIALELKRLCSGHANQRRRRGITTCLGNAGGLQWMARQPGMGGRLLCPPWTCHPRQVCPSLH